MDWEIRNKSNGLHKEGSLIPKKKETHCTNHRLQRLLSTQICWAPPTIEWMLILQPHVDLPFNLFGPWACKRWLSQIDTKHSSCSKGNRRIYSEPNTGGRGLGTQTRVTLYGDLNGKYPLLAQTFEYLILSWWHCLGVGGIGGVDFPEEVCRWEQALRVRILSILPVCSLCFLFGV